jgi:hypothetical protein
MTEVKYDKGHHAGGTPEARIASRLKNSGEGSGATHSVTHGTGPVKTTTNIHPSGSKGSPFSRDGEGGKE